LAVRGAAARWRVLQRGRLQLYVLYVAATLVVLLLWSSRESVTIAAFLHPVPGAALAPLLPE